MTTLAKQESDTHFHIVPEQFVAQGWHMAEQEGEAAFESIEIRHGAERGISRIATTHIEATGHATLKLRDSVQTELQESGFNITEHLQQIARGRVDLKEAIALFAISTVLALAVLLAFSPLWMAVFLSLVIGASAGAVEEFFYAHRERDVLRQALFFTLTVLAVAGSFVIGTARAKIMAAVADAGEIGHLLRQTGTIVQAALGVLAVVAEVLCGFKLFRARSALLSAAARGYRELEMLNARLTGLSRSLEAAKAGPEIARQFRVIGARQQIAWASSAEERARATHFARAMKYALITLLILAILLLLTSRLEAAPIGVTVHVVLLDLSRSTSTANFHANVNGVGDLIQKLKPGERIVVIPISDRFSGSVLLDKTLAVDVGSLGLRERADREAIGAEWRSIAQAIKPVYARTDILGALASLPYRSNLGAVALRIYIFSDLQQDTPQLDLEHAPSISVVPAIARLKRANAIPHLTGAKIYAVGVDPVGKSAHYYAQLREFWSAYFAAAGADLRTFSLDRSIPEF